MNVSIVVPCYKSAGTLAELVTRTRATMDGLIVSGAVSDWEMILVVDGDSDLASVVVRGLAVETPRVRGIELRRNFGQHNALIAGIRDCRFDVTVTLDDDLQHPPEEIPRLLEAISSPSCDLVYAVPEDEEHGMLRSWASRVVKNSLALAGVPNARWVSAFRAFRTDLRDGFAVLNDPQPNLDVLLSWSTTAVVPTTVTMVKRQVGRSTYTFRQLIHHALNMITGYGVAPLKLATWLGFSCGALGVLLLVIVLVRYAFGETTVAGYTTTVALISLFAGAQMITIGIIGEYLGRQHFRSMGKPTYLIARRYSASQRDSLGGDRDE